MAAAAAAAAAAATKKHLTTGAKQIRPEDWRDKDNMAFLATTVHKCALSKVDVAPAADGGDAVARHAKKHVDHVVECSLLSTLFWAAVKYVVPAAIDGEPVPPRTTVVFSKENDPLFKAAYVEANSLDLNLMVLAAAEHDGKTSFFKHVVRAVKGALEAGSTRKRAPFPSLISTAHELCLTGAARPDYEKLQLWGLVYATFANRLWARVQLLGLHPLRVSAARFVCERLDALGACPTGLVYGLVDLRVQATLAYTAKMEDFEAANVEADPTRLWDARVEAGGGRRRGRAGARGRGAARRGGRWRGRACRAERRSGGGAGRGRG